MPKLPYPIIQGVYIIKHLNFQYILQKKHNSKSAKITMIAQPPNLFKLTQEQARVLQSRLPKGYNIYLSSRPSKRESARNNQAMLKGRKRDVSSESSQAGRQRKKPQPFIDEELSNRIPKTFTQEQRKCHMVMQKLRRHPAAHHLFRTMDAWRNNPLVPEYIDLLIIDQNVRNGHYNSILQFWADIRKVWQNFYLTNGKESELYQRTTELEAFFDEQYKEAEKPHQKNNNFNDLQKKVDKLTRELTLINQQQIQPTRMAPPPPPKRIQPYVHPSLPVRKASKSSKSQSKLEIPMTIQEKKNLGMNIRTLPPEFLKGVWEIVSEGMSVQHASEELEFDIDTLPVKKTRMLERYVNTKLQQINRQSQKQQPTGQVSNDTVKMNQPLPVAASYAPPPIFENDTAESSFSSDPDESI